MRWLVIWLVLAGAYVATSGIDAVEGERYGGDEPHYLLIAESIVSGGEIDLADDYAARSYDGFFGGVLRPDGKPTEGRLHEPHGVGLPLLIAPAYAVAGADGAVVALAALAALAFVLGGLLARRVVPEPWVAGGTLLVGLSAPALAYGSSVHPDLLAGGVLAGAVLLAALAREEARLRWVYGSAFLLAALPWLGVKFLPAALVVLVALVLWTYRNGRRLTALIASEVVFASLVIYATVNEQFYGGPTPYSALAGDASPTGADTVAEHLERLPRLLTLWVDPGFGLVRWAPVLLIGFVALWRLWRSRRERLARAVPGRAAEEAAALLALATAGAVLAVAVFAAPEAGGDWLGPRHLVAVLPLAVLFVAWGLRHVPKPAAYVVAAASLAISVVVVADLAGGGSWAGA